MKLLCIKPHKRKMKKLISSDQGLTPGANLKYRKTEYIIPAEEDAVAVALPLFAVLVPSMKINGHVILFWRSHTSSSMAIQQHGPAYAQLRLSNSNNKTFNFKLHAATAT